MDVPRLAVGDVYQSHDHVAKSRQRLVDAASLLQRVKVSKFPDTILSLATSIIIDNGTESEGKCKYHASKLAYTIIL